MNVTHKDFLATYTDVYPTDYCEHLITEFERLVASGAGRNRQQSEKAAKHVKDDMQLILNVNAHNLRPFDGRDAVDVFFHGLQQCYDEYSEMYSVLKDGRINGSTMKMQRTDSGGGYHIWHCEQNNGRQAERVLVYMLYLNTLNPEDGGETEFLYQKTRVSPQKNTMLLWPAAFTHAHRGNTVLGLKSKYIVTGWFYYD